MMTNEDGSGNRCLAKCFPNFFKDDKLVGPLEIGKIYRHLPLDAKICLKHGTLLLFEDENFTKEDKVFDRYENLAKRSTLLF